MLRTPFKCYVRKVFCSIVMKYIKYGIYVIDNYIVCYCLITINFTDKIFRHLFGYTFIKLKLLREFLVNKYINSSFTLHLVIFKKTGIYEIIRNYEIIKKYK